MNKIKVTLSALLLLAGVTMATAAGSIPASQLQYPYYVWTSTGVTNSGTVETNLVQWSIPQQALGTAGFLRISLFEKSPDAAAANHTYKVYIGGSGNPVSGGTALFTNVVVQAPSALVQRTILMNGALNAAYAVGDNSTNTFTGYTTISIPMTFNTTTNFLLTVTGAGQFSTNVFGLDGAIVEAVTSP